MQERTRIGRFIFDQADTPAVGSVLYEQHLKLPSRLHMNPFCGYIMPLWYSTIAAEHLAVRQAAGLFDCTHMGALDVSGAEASDFLDYVTTNKITDLGIGSARYSYILDAAGNILDDIIIYRRASQRFMVVVNAANEPKIKAYFKALLNDEVPVDAEDIKRKLPYKPDISDMRDTSQSRDCRVDIALQGPRSLDIVLALTDAKAAEQIAPLRPFHFVQAALGKFDCIIARTGYTGSKIGFELFVHPDDASKLWEKMLQKFEGHGLVPCGLGARDSLRIEAGLPLYGHELAGQFDISPFEAGYGWAVKLDKKFFIGKKPMEENSENFDMEVARVELPGEKGVRPVRQNDAVLNSDGQCTGWVLSCAKIEEKQIAMVYMSKEYTEQGNPVGLYYLARSQGQLEQGRKDRIKKAEHVSPDLTGVVLSRFAKF
ncbi:MAG: glycine cleavage system protein T [Planctomycetes bacterium RBG_13_50_24]|nr:MAG: glycine cleavage system protein T [Planctomycetes bacterium RBG_13_50_24]